MKNMSLLKRSAKEIIKSIRKMFTKKVVRKIGDIVEVNVKSLKIDKRLLGSKPSVKTYRKHLDYFKQHGALDKVLEVYLNKEGQLVLTKRYARYLVLLKNKVEQTQVKIISVVA